MKKIKLIMLLLALIPSQIYATSGRLKGNSIVTCNGQSYGQHGDGHWHIAVQRGDYWYPSGSSLSDNPCSSTSSSNSLARYTAPVVISKSSDTSLKEIKVNNDILDINDNMNYSTKESKIDINVTTNDSKSSVNIFGNYNQLNVGDNKVTIKIVAEDKTEKEYILNVYRQSSNNNATIKYNKKKIKFTKNKSEKIKVKKKVKSISFDISLDDDNAKSNIKKSYKLKKGNNKITITVTAENGKKKKYIINVYRKKGIFG